MLCQTKKQKGILLMISSLRIPRWDLPEKPNVFVLHCGLDINKVERSCEKADLPVNLILFRREEIFSYYVRLGRPRPDLIIIRSHFRSLVDSLHQVKDIPTIVISTHEKPTNCVHPFIQACQGYGGPETFTLYEQLTLSMSKELSAH
jgi:hypothetical protein